MTAIHVRLEKEYCYCVNTKTVNNRIISGMLLCYEKKPIRCNLKKKISDMKMTTCNNTNQRFAMIFKQAMKLMSVATHTEAHKFSKVLKSCMLDCPFEVVLLAD